MKNRRWIKAGFRTAIFLMLAVTATGCRSWWPFTQTEEEALLGSRKVVPPPYRQPVPQVEQEPELQTAPPPVPLTDEPPMLEDEHIDFQEKEDEVKLPAPVESRTLTYEVQKGDSLWEIARKYGITHQELAAYNNMDVNDTLQAGTVLTIPPGGRPLSADELKTVPKTAPSRSTTNKSVQKQMIPADGVYEVKSGDNLWVIASRFGVSVKNIKQLNNLTSDTIQPGQKLKIPAGGTTAEKQPATSAPQQEEKTVAPAQQQATEQEAVEETEKNLANEVVSSPALAYPKTMPHVISQNDTLEVIAEMYGTTVEDIKKVNPDIDSNEDLKPNTELLVPYTEE